MAQTPLDGTIFNVNHIPFMSGLYDIKPGTLEETVQILWNLILNTWFPPRSYHIAIKGPVLTDNGQPDGVVIEVRLNENAIRGKDEQYKKRQVFILECKRMDKDNPALWERTELQLLRYMQAHNNPAECTGLYGACAIGKKVVFYEWLSITPKHLRRLTEIINLELPADRVKLEQRLDLIKLNGWNLAGGQSEM